MISLRNSRESHGSDCGQGQIDVLPLGIAGAVGGAFICSEVGITGVAGGIDSTWLSGVGTSATVVGNGGGAGAV